MGWNFRTVGSIAAAIGVSAAFTSPISHADDGWVAGATAAAGPYANDIQERCTWWPRSNPNPQSPGTPLATLFT